MLNPVDNFLNKITMYRLVLYYLFALLGVAVILCFFGILRYSPIALLYSAFVIIAVSWFTNWIFSRVFRVAANNESVYITALILTLIVSPVLPSQTTALPFLVWVAIWASASKFIFAIGKKHLFNPAAFATAFVGLMLGSSATWWAVSNPSMLAPIILGGLLVVRKLRQSDLATSFIGVSLIAITTSAFFAGGSDIFGNIKIALLGTPLFFFAFVMLTEPFTMPPTRSLRVIYGAIVGFLFTTNMHVGSFYFTPEIALVLGNIFSYAVSPKGKYLLSLKRAEKIALDTYDYVFTPDKPVRFRPGQYVELTLGHAHSDTRGSRRYFTIASSPTEPDIRFGAKFYPAPSSFKKALATLSPGGTMIAGQLAGDFTLPKDTKQKLVFIAGGIGVTPFRSMVKFLIDTKEHRTITLFYSNKTIDEIAYKDIFDQAEKELGVKTVYTVNELTGAPPGWGGYTGFLTGEIIAKEVPDYRERMFYLSGPHGMVSAFEKILSGMGVPRRNIKTDFFPGYA